MNSHHQHFGPHKVIITSLLNCLVWPGHNAQMFQFRKMPWILFFFLVPTVVFAGGSKPLLIERWKLENPATPVETVTIERIKALKARIAPEVSRCLGTLESRLGRNWPLNSKGKPKRLNIKLVADQEEFEGAAETSGMFLININLKILPFISGEHDFEKTLCHEMVHAYFRFFMNSFSYDKVPRWLREGSAVYLAGQTKEKMETMLLEHYLDPEKIINGLEGDHSFKDYYEDALTFHMLDKHFGDKSADQFLSDVLAGDEISEIVTRRTSMELRQFFDWAKVSALEHIKYLLRPVTREFLNIAEKLRTRTIRQNAAYQFYLQEFERIKIDWRIEEDLLRTENDIYVQVLLTAMIKTFDFRMENEKAITLLTHLIGRGPEGFMNSEIGKMRYLLSSLLETAHRAREALQQMAIIYNEHPSMGQVQRLLPLGFAQMFLALEDWQKVLDWGKDKPFYHESNRHEMTYFRAYANWKLGKRDRALKELNRLANIRLSVSLKPKVDALRAELR